jgi:hypothetical protein
MMARELIKASIVIAFACENVELIAMQAVSQLAEDMGCQPGEPAVHIDEVQPVGKGLA